MKIGLALGGGGAKGLCHISFLQVFDDLGLKPYAISGTSIGAMTGAYYAGGMTADEILEMVNGMGLRQITRMLDFNPFKVNGALIKGEGVERFLHDTLPVRTFNKLKIPLKISATDFWKRSEVVLSEGSLVKAVRASISLPAIFEPLKYKGRLLSDGGAVNPLPFDLLPDDCDVVIAVDVSGTKMPDDDSPYPGAFESIFNTFQIMQATIIREKREQDKVDFYLQPKLVNIRVLEFDKSDEILASVDKEKKALKTFLEQKLAEFG